MTRQVTSYLDLSLTFPTTNLATNREAKVVEWDERDGVRWSGVWGDIIGGNTGVAKSLVSCLYVLTSQ